MFAEIKYECKETQLKVRFLINLLGSEPSTAKLQLNYRTTELRSYLQNLAEGSEFVRPGR